MALGATPADIFRGVLRRGLGLAALGVTLGLGATLGLTHFMQSLLFETSPYDPAVYALVAALLIGVSALAAWLPARRATRINPVEALRAE
jgi:ABC-type antimicrobial peptide transport system permease subunit